ncbi:MAG: WxL protein peptidoglycan domain-containing protein, partial [Pseudonocardiaceae bacterium]
MSARAARAATAVVATGVALSWAALLAATPSAVAAAPAPDPPAPGPASEPIAIGTGPAGSTAAGQLTWGVSPAHAESTPARTAFTYAVEPGWRIPDAVRITNFANTALGLQVYAQDGLTTRDGGFDLLSGDQAASDLGTWVRIGARSVTVPARSRIDVPFVIEVPADARPGDHAGGIVAAIVDQRRSINDQVVRFEQRVGARLYLRVPGEITAGLAVEDLRVTYETSMNPLNPGLARLTYT